MNKWNGEGLPPVGSKVIVNIGCTTHPIFKEIEGKEVEVVFHSETFDGDDVAAIFRWSDGDAYKYHGLVEGNFLPTKSDSEKAIDEMIVIFNCCNLITVKDGIKALYDAGYRKVDFKNE